MKKPAILGVQTGEIAFTTAVFANGRKMLLLALTYAELEKMREGAVIHLHGEEVEMGNIELYVLPFADVAAVKDQMNQVKERFSHATEKKPPRLA